jgi:hypothetical protein
LSWLTLGIGAFLMGHGLVLAAAVNGVWGLLHIGMGAILVGASTSRILNGGPAE